MDTSLTLHTSKREKDFVSSRIPLGSRNGYFSRPADKLHTRSILNQLLGKWIYRYGDYRYQSADSNEVSKRNECCISLHEKSLLKASAKVLTR